MKIYNIAGFFIGMSFVILSFFSKEGTIARILGGISVGTMAGVLIMVIYYFLTDKFKI